jgi:hypothetical protein
MDSSPFYINILINSAKFIKAFINNDCLCYAVFNESIVRALKLSRIFILHKSLKFAEKDMEERRISFITYADVDIDGYKKRIFGYIIKKLAFFFILGDTWLKYNDVIYKAKKRQFRIKSKKHKLIIKKSGWLDRQKDKNARLMNARVFAALIRRNEQDYRKRTEEVRKISRASKEEYVVLQGFASSPEHTATHAPL